ncbi:hypothetical protein [Saccharicrinis sp. 156]|uniref:hypothetical protein n=1 Tax=Saccharicrinis sp. 156 TaxID=3417574 RepID=UPI003D34EC1F
MVRNVIWLLFISIFILSCGDDNDDTIKEIEEEKEIEETDVINISSLQELISYAAIDSVEIKMEPGTYNIDDISTSKELDLDSYSGSSVTGVYSIVTLLHFSGSHSIYDLSGVEIVIDTEIYDDLPEKKIFDVLISGSDNNIKGLKVTNSGNNVPKVSAIAMVVLGNQNTLEEVDLFVSGSSPYGYGFLLGKDTSYSIVSKLQKHSSLLISGTGTNLLKCEVITRAFGHGIVMQGAVDTFIEECYVEGAVRTTDEMLAETSGLAYENNFRSVYPPGSIVSGQMIALSEDGIRTYSSGNLVPTKTNNVTVINCTVKNMRGGYDLVACSGDRIINGCTAIGCQTQGFSGGSGIAIQNSKGDAMYGPLLSFWYTSSKNCSVALQLLDTKSDYMPSRLAEINGTGHTINISNAEGNALDSEIPIVFGESFWADVREFRNPDENPDDMAGAWSVNLTSSINMPLHLNKLTELNYITTNNNNVTDEGTNNTIVVQ